MYGDGSLVPVGHRRYYILRPKGSIAAKEHSFVSRYKCCRVHNWHIPFVKVYTQVALYPWKAVFLAYSYQYIVCLVKDIRITNRH